MVSDAQLARQAETHTNKGTTPLKRAVRDIVIDTATDSHTSSLLRATAPEHELSASDFRIVAAATTDSATERAVPEV